MLVNNETGAIQPVAEIARRCRARGVACHTDAVQAVGKIAVDFAALGVDALTFAPHKLHGPLGIGGLLLAHGVKPRPVLWGGFQQESLRPGTEPVALAIAAAESLRLAVEELPARAAQMARLRDQFEARLLAELSNLAIHGRDAERAPGTSLISFVGVDRQALLMALDLAGVACSTGSACQSGSSEPSPVLLAMGCPEAWTASALRFSLGAFTTAEEIESAARIIAEQVRRMRAR
jgi:cysteine desulfurase